LMLEYLLIDSKRVYITREFDVQYPQL
jgi:hypothetical protein